MSHDKLYWDAEYPSPDRDLTTQRYPIISPSDMLYGMVSDK